MIAEETNMLPGVFRAQKRNGEQYFRAGFTFKNKHISLGSYQEEKDAFLAYETARYLIQKNITIEDALVLNTPLKFEKIVIICNFRDSGLYSPTPLYLRKHYFSYYLTPELELKFDIDDLFYYSGHKILRRGGHLFVNDYGMQITLLSRYGIRPYAVMGRDYFFANGDESDFRYSNLIVVNSYFGVTRMETSAHIQYKSTVHVAGNRTVGVYTTEEDAAIAYNKATDLLCDAGISKNYPKNYIETISSAEYLMRYQKIKLGKTFLDYLNQIKGLK